MGNAAGDGGSNRESRFKTRIKGSRNSEGRRKKCRHRASHLCGFASFGLGVPYGIGEKWASHNQGAFVTFLWMFFRIAALLMCICSLATAAETNRAPFVVFVTGDHEYSSERTMPLLAAALETNFGFRTKVLYATEPSGRRNEGYEKNIPGLENLKSADLAIFFLRFRQLPQEQLDYIQQYLDSGKPLMGFRTASHSFLYPANDPRARWNAFGEVAFGTPPGWGAAGHTHFGHESSTDVTWAPHAEGNPLLQGVDKSFHVRSWLYRVLPHYPPRDATWLLVGTAINPDKPAEPNPVAWTWKTKQGARSFYTSMGHPNDFGQEPFQRLVVNAVFWALDRPEPAWPGRLPIDVSYEKPARKDP
jgi:type 1 glutamine amidotransferase